LAVERPYDPTPDDEGRLVVDLPESVDNNEEDDEGPMPTEDPSLFEWRNLKKLIVLVLSSLVWKSPNVQTQIRQHGGVETILNCTANDGNNPYIKEHAIMCLKFLLESNKENQAIVKELEARNIAETQEVERLRNMGMDVGLENGRVKVTRTGSGSGGIGRAIRRASEGSAPTGVREKLSGLNIGGRQEAGRVLGEDAGEG
jgi:palmitoyltransferase